MRRRKNYYDFKNDIFPKEQNAKGKQRVTV